VASADRRVPIVVFSLWWATLDSNQ
jgi:hypothetical protein